MAGLALPTANASSHHVNGNHAVNNSNSNASANGNGSAPSDAKDANAAALQDYKNSALGSADAAIQQGLPLPVLQ